MAFGTSKPFMLYLDAGDWGKLADQLVDWCKVTFISLLSAFYSFTASLSVTVTLQVCMLCYWVHVDT